MKIATWNVNSLKVRLPQVIEWLDARGPDVLCLQEIKCQDENFPAPEIEAAGYHAICAGQKAYNGVAILSRAQPEEVAVGIPGHDDGQKRALAACIQGVRIISVYVPNGESTTSPKYGYKLDWLLRLRAWLMRELEIYPRLAVLGDFNIAPDERDVYDPKAWEGKVLFSAPEREAFSALLRIGLADSFRLTEQPQQMFTWWDYRLNAFKRNLGLRIDHILLSSDLAPNYRSFEVDRAMRGRDRPSDHAPVIAEIAL